MKLPQLSLRDLFWLVLVCGLLVALWIERSRPKREADLWKENAAYWRGNAEVLADTLRGSFEYEVVFDGVPPTP
jgi:hypothetical protein